MEKEDLEIFKQKKIKIILRNGYVYTGEIESLGTETVRFRDKYNELLLLNLGDIKTVIPVREEAQP